MPDRERQVLFLVAIVWIGLLAYHSQKALGFYPLIIPDEYTYSLNSRLRAFSEAPIPNYLYYAIFRITNLFGERYLDAARVLNAIIFMASAPFVFLTARIVCGKGLALFLAAMTLVGPMSSYTAYFMPESTYFTAFWFFAWLELKRDRIPLRAHGLAAGAAIALMSLIKMHGIFLLPGFALYIIITERSGEKKGYVGRVVKTGLYTALAFAVVRFGVGYLFAGVRAFHLIGSEYNEIYSDSNAGGGLAALAYYSGVHLLGNITGICIVFGVPLLVMGRVGSGGSAAKLRKMVVFVVSFMAPLLVVTSVFSGMAQMAYPGESVVFFLRLQTRYCNFLFPYFLIIAGGFYALPEKEAGRRAVEWILPAVLLALSLFAFVFHLYGYYAEMLPEAPEVGAIFFYPTVYYAFAVLATACLVWAVFATRKGCAAYLYVFLPVYSLVSTAIIHNSMVHSFGLFPEFHDKAGVFARDYLGKETSELTVVDSFTNTPKKTLMHIDNAATDLLPQFTPTVDMSLIKPGKKWLLVLGGLEVPERAKKFSITHIDPAQDENLTAMMRERNDFRSMLRYQLIRIADFDFSVDFALAEHEWPVGEVRFENGGIMVVYRAPLPKRGTLAVDLVSGSGGKTGEGVTVRIGDAGTRLKVVPGEARAFVSDGKAASVFIDLDGRVPPNGVARLRIQKQAGER